MVVSLGCETTLVAGPVPLTFAEEPGTASTADRISSLESESAFGADGGAAGVGCGFAEGVGV